MKKEAISVQDMRGMVRDVVKDLTPEQKQEHFNRLVQQSLESWTMGIVFNAVHGNADLTPEKGKELVNAAVETAYEMLRLLRGVVRKEPEAE